MADPASAPGATPDGSAKPPAAEAPPVEPPRATRDDDDDGDLGDAGKRALAELRRLDKGNRKTIEEQARKLKSYEDAERTDTERLSARVTELEAELTPARREVLATRVAVQEGLDAEWWDRLKGENEDELREDAKRLVERFGSSKNDRPAPDFGAGARPSAPATGNEAFNERIRRRAG